eukprot:403341590
MKTFAKRFRLNSTGSAKNNNESGNADKGFENDIQNLQQSPAKKKSSNGTKGGLLGLIMLLKIKQQQEQKMEQDKIQQNQQDNKQNDQQIQPNSSFQQLVKQITIKHKIKLNTLDPLQYKLPFRKTSQQEFQKEDSLKYNKSKKVTQVEEFSLDSIKSSQQVNQTPTNPYQQQFKDYESINNDLKNIKFQIKKDSSKIRSKSTLKQINPSGLRKEDFMWQRNQTPQARTKQQQPMFINNFYERPLRDYINEYEESLSKRLISTINFSIKQEINY